MNPSTVLRTPDDRFDNLPDYPFEPHYVAIDGGRIRMHYVDDSPVDGSGETIVMLHGNPSWSYLYRHVIPPLVAAGHRCVAVDLVGFGRSDKLANRFEYTYEGHVEWLREALFDRLDLRDVTLVAHDWGGALGFPLLARTPERFRRVVAVNTGLSTGDEDLGEGWPLLANWLQSSQRDNPFEPSKVVEMFTVSALAPAVLAAYDAPYPEEAYLQGVRQFPLLIPISPRDENTPALREVWKQLEKLEIPLLCAFSDQDHTSGGDHSSVSERIPGAKGQPHTVVENAGHFLQEDQGPALADVIDDFINSTR
ncbi:haloalkane dehalogenase [Nonomuraea sp. SBT364]|uniref:haloalkane dehalogenase n=1 Tax=Nonomuraea sp. SBT364 TaxID=1580530 RepID=UPI00066C72E2|nr:haloalkane dehalogenase [Nonomuraea sp. SBT364]